MTMTRPLADQLNYADAGRELGLRNAFINGNFLVWQRGVSFTPSVGALTYTADRWYCLATGASPSSVTKGQLGAFSYLTVNGAAGNTAVTVGQRIESANCYNLHNKTVTITATLRREAGGTGPVTVYLRQPTTAADNFSSVTVLGSATAQVNGTLSQYTFTITPTASANAYGLEVVFDFGAVGSGKQVVIGKCQIEAGAQGTKVEYRPYGTELALCQRYYQTGYQIIDSYTIAGGAVAVTLPFPVTPRATPTITPTAAGLNTNHGAISASTVAVNSLTYAAFIWANATATGTVRIESSFTTSAEL